MKEQFECQTARQAQKAKAAATAIAARMAMQPGKAAKLTISNSARDMGIGQAISNAVASIASLQLIASGTPSLLAAAAGKENSKSGVVKHPAGALGGSSARPCTGAIGKRCAAGQLPDEAPSAQHLGAQEQDQPLKRRRRMAARWLPEYDLV